MQSCSTLMLAGGRRLTFASCGDADGMPVIALHGTPGSALRFNGAEAAARASGLRLICPDRWGYGRSDAPAAPGLNAYGEDMVALADHLGANEVGVLGVSGGGPFAIATAAALGKRASRLALAGPVGEVSEQSGFSLLHRICFGLVARRGPLVASGFSLYRRLLTVAPGFCLHLATVNAPACDREIVRDRVVGRTLVDSYRRGLETGVCGPVIDLALFSQGLDRLPEQVLCQVRIWIGTADGNVPMVGVQRLAERLADCRIVRLDGEGHFWIFGHYGEVLDWLAGRPIATAN